MSYLNRRQLRQQSGSWIVVATWLAGAQHLNFSVQQMLRVSLPCANFQRRVLLPFAPSQGRGRVSTFHFWRAKTYSEVVTAQPPKLKCGHTDPRTNDHHTTRRPVSPEPLGFLSFLLFNPFGCGQRPRRCLLFSFLVMAEGHSTPVREWRSESTRAPRNAAECHSAATNRPGGPRR